MDGDGGEAAARAISSSGCADSRRIPGSSRRAGKCGHERVPDELFSLPSPQMRVVYFETISKRDSTAEMTEMRPGVLEIWRFRRKKATFCFHAREK